MLTDGRRTDAGVIGILIAHLGAFGSGELIRVFRVTGLKILARVGTHICFLFFFSGKNIIFCILRPFKSMKL